HDESPFETIMRARRRRATDQPISIGKARGNEHAKRGDRETVEVTDWRALWRYSAAPFCGKCSLASSRCVLTPRRNWAAVAAAGTRLRSFSPRFWPQSMA